MQAARETAAADAGMGHGHKQAGGVLGRCARVRYARCDARTRAHFRNRDLGVLLVLCHLHDRYLTRRALDAQPAQTVHRVCSQAAGRPPVRELSTPWTCQHRTYYL